VATQQGSQNDANLSEQASETQAPPAEPGQSSL
jgi:hypothetical protein